ncbi:MAG: hypothetical protein HOQ32_03310 [Lysobacter sp.]|nr:hypothetical protein [Lysobacter sp.]
MDIQSEHASPCRRSRRLVGTGAGALGMRAGKRGIGLAAIAMVAMAIAVWVWSGRGARNDAVADHSAQVRARSTDPTTQGGSASAVADVAGGKPASRGPGRAHYSITRSYQPIPGDAAQVFATLEAQARTGDHEAALNLYIKVNDCRLATANAITRAPQTDPRALIPLDCRSLTPEHYREAARWLERAADGGNVYAQFMYVDSIEGVLGPRSEWLRDPPALERYKRKSMAFLHENAARGSLDALDSLARTYAVGVRAPQDYVKSYAYFYAMKLADPNPAMTWRRMDEVGQRLSPQQLSQATQQGRRIYEQCCTH